MIQGETMGRRPKTMEEVESFKNKILDKTLQLIAKEGYEGFSIRKLGPKLGIAPKTVYNYFKSKDEIYLHVLINGFELLYKELSQSIQTENVPYKQLEAFVKAFIRFGFEKSNYYDIMMTLHIPKFNEFRGTTLEPLAFNELQTALKSFKLLLSIIEHLDITDDHIKHGNPRMSALQLLVAMHGIVSLKNNTILDYLHKDPENVIAPLIQAILNPFRPPDI